VVRGLGGQVVKAFREVEPSFADGWRNGSRQRRFQTYRID